MKIIDQRIQKEEVKDLSQEMIETLSSALDEDYGVMLEQKHQQFLQNELRRILSKFFDIKP
jgi:hypothetical protein